MKLLLRFFTYLLKIVIILNHKLYKRKICDDGIVHSIVPQGDYYVEGIKNLQYLSALHLKSENTIYEITTRNGHKIRCSEHHLFYTPNFDVVQAKDLTKYSFLVTREGSSKIKSIKKKKIREFTYDCTIASGGNSYYADGILSHNSVISGIYISWYLLFNYDKVVLCTSANFDKVKELLDKIDVIMIHLPFYMKLGIEVDNVKLKRYDNGCKLMGETATENSGAGVTANLLYADEFALVDPSTLDNFFRVIYPTLSANKTSKMIITSTARGHNKFYELYRDALLGINSFNPIRVDYWEVEGRDDEWKRQQIADLGSEESFNQEYGNAFNSSANLLFSPYIFKKLKKYERVYKNNQLSEYYEEI